jgi:hypothetical protein
MMINVEKASRMTGRGYYGLGENLLQCCSVHHKSHMT